MRKQTKKGQASKRSKDSMAASGDSGVTSPSKKCARLSRRKSNEDSQSTSQEPFSGGGKGDKTPKKLVPTFGKKKTTASTGNSVKQAPSTTRLEQEGDGSVQISNINEQNSTSAHTASAKEGRENAPIQQDDKELEGTGVSTNKADESSEIKTPYNVTERDNADANNEDTDSKAVDDAKQNAPTLLAVVSGKHEVTSSSECPSEATEEKKVEESDTTNEHNLEGGESSAVSNQPVNQTISSELVVAEGSVKQKTKDDDKDDFSENHPDQQDGQKVTTEASLNQPGTADTNLSKVSEEQENIAAPIKSNDQEPTLLSSEATTGDDSTNKTLCDAVTACPSKVQMDTEKASAEHPLDQSSDVKSTKPSGCEEEDGGKGVQKAQCENSDVDGKTQATGLAGLSNETNNSEMNTEECNITKNLPFSEEKGIKDVTKGGPKYQEEVVACDARKEGNDDDDSGVTTGGKEENGNSAVEAPAPRSDDANRIAGQDVDDMKDGANDDDGQAKVVPGGEVGKGADSVKEQDKVCETDAGHAEEGQVVQGQPELEAEDGLQDDDLMDFTYSQVCQMEEQCLAAVDAKKVMNKSSADGAKSVNPPQPNTTQPPSSRPSPNLPPSTKRQDPKAADVTVPSLSSDPLPTGGLLLHLPCGPSMSLRTEDLEAGAVVKGVIDELRGLNQMIMNAKKQIEAVRRQRQVKQKQQHHQPAKRQMRQQKLLPSGSRQVGSYHQQQLHKDPPKWKK